MTGDEIQLYFDRNLETLKTVISCAEKAAKIRKTEERAKTNLLTKQKFSFDSNGKLANCESRDPPSVRFSSWREILPGVPQKQPETVCIRRFFPSGGKILNVEKASIDKVLANAGDQDHDQRLRLRFLGRIRKRFDIDKLRYDKIIIMADADVDGAHISTLLLTLFYRFMPELIYQGACLHRHAATVQGDSLQGKGGISLR